MKKVYWIIGAIVVIGAGVGVYIYYKRKKEDEANATRQGAASLGSQVKQDLTNAVASTDVSSSLDLGGMARMAAPAGNLTFGQSPLNIKGEVGNPNHGYYDKNGTWWWYPKYV